MCGVLVPLNDDPSVAVGANIRAMHNQHRVFGHCRVFSRPHGDSSRERYAGSVPGSLPRLAACACGGLLNESPE